MTSQQIFFKARQTILEMFQDRGYQGPYAQAGQLTASQFYQQSISDKGMPNYIENNDQPIMIDLWGFTEKRTIFTTVTNEDGSTMEKQIEVTIPIYVHFSDTESPKALKKKKTLYPQLLAQDNNFTRQIVAWATEQQKEHPNKPADPSKSVMKEEVLLGYHIMIVYNGWDYAQNKEPVDLFAIYSSGEREQFIYDLEIWPAHSLVVNYTQNVLVPKHKLLSREAKSQFLAAQADFYLNDADKQRYQSLKSEEDKFRFMEIYMFKIMPKIQLHDIINMWYYGRLRDIYEIVRHGQSVTYRMVKKSPLLNQQK